LKQALTPVLHNDSILPLASKDIKNLAFVTQSIHMHNIEHHNEPQNIYRNAFSGCPM
jgi:hypothetical protein